MIRVITVRLFMLSLILTDSKITTFVSSIRSCREGFVGRQCEIECGIGSYRSTNFKIVGGREVNFGNWPATAYIKFEYKVEIKLENNGPTYQIGTRSSCSGFLIDASTVLTAAHCLLTKVDVNLKNNSMSVPVVTNQFHKTYESMFTVFLGLHDLKDLSDSEKWSSSSSYKPFVSRSVKKIYKHEKFNLSLLQDDIAVLKLSEPVPLNSEYIQVACLPKSRSSKYPPVRQEAWVMGWGVTKMNGIGSQFLHEVQIFIQPNRECNSVSFLVPKNWKSQICAGDLSGGRDTCQGDSGGGLYIKDKIAGKIKFVVSGIVSYGDGCGEAFRPGVYTRISFFMKWIQSKMDAFEEETESSNAAANTRWLSNSVGLLIFSLLIACINIRC